MLKKLKTYKVFVLLLSLLLLLGISDKTKGLSTINKIKDTTAAYSVVDYEGTVITLPHKPKHILTLSLSFDIMTLGIVPPEYLVAANKMANDPGISCIANETRDIKTKLYSYPLETVVKLNPDLIIASTWTDKQMINAYRDLGYPVLVCKGPDNIEEVEQTIMTIAEALGERDTGNKIISIMERKLQYIDKVVEGQAIKKPVGLLVSQMTCYGGKGCMFDVLCTRAGVVNGIAKMGINNGQPVTKEMIIACNPDFFMLSAPRSQSGDTTQKAQEEYINDPALKELKGIRHTMFIPDRYLYSSTQNCVYAIEGIANAAYGPIFDLSDEKLIKGY